MKDPQKAEKKEAAEKPQISYAAFFRKYKKIIPVVLALILIFFCHMLINTYMINVLQDIGGNTTDQGNAIFVQAMAELPTMFLFAALLKKVKVDWLMAFGAVMYVLKHLLVCFAPSIPFFFIGMIVQMFSYAIVVPGSVYFAAEHVEAEDRNKGQAIMSASLTAGQLLASFLGGILLQAMGVHAVLILGFVMTIAGAVIMLAGIRILKH
jgi:PPP family 3-phenylpropionic acid transporter